MPVQKTLSELVSINSVFPNEARLANNLMSRLRQLGFSVRKDTVEKGRFNILAQRGSGSSSILFYGHMDTVPRYGNWNTDPFKLTPIGNRLYGLGACDMKGGIAAMLESMKGIGGQKIRIILCVDEENISRGAWNAVRRNKGWFSDVKLMVSCEAGISRAFVGGATTVTVGRRGRTVISIDVAGKSSHGANPHAGINALEEAAAISGNLSRFRLRTHKRLGTESIFTRMMQGASTSLSIPDKAHVELDVQTIPPCTSKQVLARVNEYIAALRSSGKLNRNTRIYAAVKSRATPYIDPYENSLTDRRIKGALALIKKGFGKPNLNYATSVADDNVLFNELHRPIITMGPSGGNEHSANEWVLSSSLEDMVEVYKSLIEGYSSF